MKDLTHLLTLYLVLLPLWAVISSPILIAFFLIARHMRRKSVRSVWTIVAFASAFSLLAAPVPTPIITVLVPHGLALLDKTYYSSILYGPSMFEGLWHWIIPSLVLTFAVALVIVWWYVRSPNNSFKPSTLRVPA